MVDCEMPWVAASFLKLASHGSKAPVLRQFAWPNAAVGTAISSASTAHVDRIVCIVSILTDQPCFAGLAAYLVSCFGDGTSCSCSGNSPILSEGSPEGGLDPAVIGAWSTDDEFSTPSCRSDNPAGDGTMRHDVLIALSLASMLGLAGTAVGQ